MIEQRSKQMAGLLGTFPKPLDDCVQAVRLCLREISHDLIKHLVSNAENVHMKPVFNHEFSCQLKRQKMRQFLLIITFLTSLVFANLALAETSGPHISVERIQIDDTTTLPAGVEVNFLGVIDVKPSVAESGKLATFTYGDRIYNADAALF
jgi:hypothetical protein